MNTGLISRLPNWKVTASHLVFWGCYLLFVYYFFLSRFPPQPFGARYLQISLLFVVPQIVLVYLNMGLLVPRYYAKKKPFPYFGWIIVCLVITYVLIDLSASSILPNIESVFNPRGHNRPPFKGRPPHWMKDFDPSKGIANLSILLTLAMIFLSTSIRSSQLMLNQEKEAAELKSANLDTELKFLRSQINPHFLFNALNNIYSLALSNSHQTADYLVKLSDMLRYNIYESAATRVRLSKEVDYIKNFISLQKLKDEDLNNVEVDLRNLDGDLLIEPMLLIPFVENIFKNSKIEDEKGWIKLSLTTGAKSLNFQISNSKPSHNHQKDKVGGVGLENVRRRLNLLYPDRHLLDITEDQDSFNVKLAILI